MNALTLPRYLESVMFSVIISLAFLSLYSTGSLELMIYQGGLKKKKKKSYEVWFIISEQPIISHMVSQ